MEARLGEINTSCHRLIESSNASLENKIIDKIDQLVSLVTKCDSKIESYNATIDDRINHQMMGLLRGQGFERMVSRDGEFFFRKESIVANTTRGSQSQGK